jgi:hypothetical protein
MQGKATRYKKRANESAKTSIRNFEPTCQETSQRIRQDFNTDTTNPSRRLLKNQANEGNESFEPTSQETRTKSFDTI